MAAENRTAYNNQFNGNAQVFTLISSIDPTQSLDLNKSVIKGTISKPELTGAVAYLKQNFSAKYPLQIEVFQKVNNITKGGLINQILNFVEKTLPVLCLKCKDVYTPMSQDDSAVDDVACIQCKIPAHKACYKKEEININEGIVFLCQSCLVNMGKKIKEKEEAKIKEVEEKKSENESSQEEEESDAGSWSKKAKKYRKKKTTKKSSSESSSADEKSKKTKQSPRVKKKKTLCPMLVDGNCPHGAAGKECEFLHLKKCFKYADFGTRDMHKGGCRFGNECWYYHPTLCRNSVELKTCLNDNCQYAHLKFTKRKKPIDRSDGRNNSRSYSNSQYQQSKSFNPSNQPRFEERRFNNSKSRNSYDQNESSWNQQQSAWGDTNAFKQDESFLEERLARMQKEFLFAMKKQMEAQFQQMQEWETYNTEYPRGW